ncbi:hypothetical protein [uncultured Roseibium sp.]|uniref:hypothetical protein n=1 Tax=uncultured Roseibium sp. TaxID=1936171 RepID=UPI0026301E73|nr:hypothetical protein [uncultured Roseibium sp.]
MASFEITAPDGKKYRVTGENAEGAFKALQSHLSGGGAQPGKDSDQSRVSGAADSFTQGVTFGFGDELTAIEAGVLGRTPDGGWFDYSKSFGERYDDALKAERGQQDDFRRENPITATAAELAGGLATGVGAAKGGATIVGRMAGQPLKRRIGAGVVEGGAYGAAYGTGNADENSRIEGALSGAATGAVLGGTIPVAGAGARKLAAPIANKIGKARNPISAQNSAAAERIMSDANKAGLQADDLIQGVREGRSIGQQDVMLGDLTRAVKRQPGEGRKVINDALNKGYTANNEATKDSAMSGLNAADNFYKWRDGFARSKSKNAKAAYGSAFKQNWGSKGPPFALDGIVQSGRIPAEALRSAQKIAQAEGRPFGKQLVASIDDATGAATFSRLPSLEETELIRRGLASAASKNFRSGDGSVGAAYRNLEQEIRGILDDASPALKSVRKSYATASQIQEAADEGLGLLNKSADEIEYIVSTKSKHEIEALRMGLASDLKHRIERGHLNRDAVRQVFGSERQRRALQALWPSKAGFEKFRKQMENASEFSAFRQNVQGNSRTQQDLADSGALGGGLGGAARNLMVGNVKGAAVDALISFSGRFVNPAKGLPPQQLKRMAEILVETDPTKVQALLSKAQSGDHSAHRQLEAAIRSALESPGFQRNATVGLVAASQ